MQITKHLADRRLQAMHAFILVTLFLALRITSTKATPHQAARDIHFGENQSLRSHLSVARRSMSGNGDDLNGQTYDYVVCGGGLAGLTVAARLSEDANV
jgi:hypothetical protein